MGAQASALQQKAQQQFGYRDAQEGKPSFETEKAIKKQIKFDEPTAGDDQGAAAKEKLRDLEQLIQKKGSFNYGNEPEILQLENLSKTKSKTHMEEEQAAQEDEEELQQDEEQKARNKTFIDVSSGKPYDPKRKFGSIEDGTQ